MQVDRSFSLAFAGFWKGICVGTSFYQFGNDVATHLQSLVQEHHYSNLVPKQQLVHLQVLLK
jgi:hypothetical protein